MNNERGFILLLTFIFMVVLTALVGSLLFMVTYETRDMGAQIDDFKMINLAEAGVQRAMREIRDDITSTTQTGIADLRGNTTTGTAGSDTEMDRVRYYNESSGILTMDAAGSGTRVVLRNLDLNYLRTNIKNVKIGCRYRKSGSGGTNPRLEILYTTIASFPEPGNSSFDTVVTSTSFNASPFIVLDITADRTWAWPSINSTDFRIRARPYNSSDRDVQVDYLFLQVIYEIDTNTEPWSTGSFTAFPISLGSGTIQSISIIAEQGKVHLNTASQSLLRYLMAEHGVADATANTVATNIINYRATNNFDSIEEAQQVPGMSLSIYDAIKPDITVYSFINTYAQGPQGTRAPVNINTASREVLEAIFDPLTFNSPSDITDLVNAIITQRNITPFTCFYSSDASVTSDFYDFERSQSYLSNAEDDRVLGNADASVLVPRSGGDSEDALTTEFCYDTNTFKVESLADVLGRKIRIKTILGDDGAHTFTTFVGDTTSIGYRKENFE